MGLKKLIKWSIMCRNQFKPKQRSEAQSTTQQQPPEAPPHLHFVSGNTYQSGNRNTRRLLVLLEDLRRLYADSWAKVMGSLEKCYDAVEAHSPTHLKPFCAIILLWVQLGDTIANTFDASHWKEPHLARVSSTNCKLVRRWKDAMERTSNFIYQYRTEAPPLATSVFDHEHQACRLETAILFQVTPDRLCEYVTSIKAYASKSRLRRKDEKKFLDTEATLTKSLSQLNIAQATS